MTLAVLMSLFRQMTKTNVANVSDPAVVEMINAGMRFAAEDVGGLRGRYNDSLVIGQSEYPLAAEVLKVSLVRLLDGETLKVELVPTDPNRITGRDESSEVSSGTPSACCVTLSKLSDANAAVRVLKFDCPPSWGVDPASDSAVGNDDIEFYCTMTPSFLDDTTKEPDLPQSLGLAGFFYACYLATLENRFMQMYDKHRNTYLRTGIGNEPRALRKPGYAVSSRRLSDLMPT
ncbi:unnamed protein product [marine sediment metagenome]|uniref:Uncharacterized protein n=1 Tax=marine sediment metagenome TaxID=412755 RepID=X0YDW5_9ZZZZ